MWGALVERRGGRGVARAGARPSRLRRLAARPAAHVAADGRRRRRASTSERADGPVALCVHDWGGLIGLRWACDHPEKVRALVICATGFFPDGKWHGLAKAMRTEGEGEEIVDGTTREAFGQMLAAVAPGIGEQAIDEYFKAYADPVRRRGQLELYRSGDFAELEPYRGRLAALGVPTLLLFGSEDPFARVATRASPGRGDPARAHRGARRHRALHVRRGARARGGDRRGLPGASSTDARLGLGADWVGGSRQRHSKRRDHMQGALRRLAWAAAAVCMLFVVLSRRRPAAHQGRAPRYRRSTGSRAATRPNVTCATARGAARLRPARTARPSSCFVAKSPATDQAQQDRLAVHQLRRPRRHGRRHASRRAGGRRVPGAERALRHHRHGSARRRAERAVDRLQGQPGDRTGIYSQPFTTPDNLDAARAVAKDLRYITRCIALNRQILAARLDGERRARHGPAAPGRWASRSSTTSASPTARSWARPTRACSRTTTARWCSTGRSTPTPTSTTRCADLSAQSGGFERALGRFFQACAADQAACRGFGGSDPWDASTR